eukprot:9001260-Pyramimonas_sp.AAC.1
MKQPPPLYFFPRAHPVADSCVSPGDGRRHAAGFSRASPAANRLTLGADLYLIKSGVLVHILGGVCDLAPVLQLGGGLLVLVLLPGLLQNVPHRRRHRPLHRAAAPADRGNGNDKIALRNIVIDVYCKHWRTRKNGIIRKVYRGVECIFAVIGTGRPIMYGIIPLTGAPFSTVAAVPAPPLRGNG